MVRRRTTVVLLLLFLFAIGVFSVRQPISYLLKQGVFQGELLWGRVPLQEAIDSGRFTDEQVRKLQLVPEIKSFGEKIGLSATQNYDSINPSWSRTIYNVSAAESLAFVNRRWWFPIVGSMPYLGFFQKKPADDLAVQLEKEGFDVYIRTAGAYSTLGWFRDPLTPNMLKWREYSLANTILHELAHATVWVRGSVQFNESFANFVGDMAARQYMIEKYGDASPEVEKMRQRIEDSARWRNFMHGIYRDLDTIYSSERPDSEKQREKHRVFSSLVQRVESEGFEDPARWKRAIEKGTWNNARMMQYRTYNRSRHWFQLLYEQQDEDLLKFMDAISSLTADASNPYRALAEAVGENYDAKDTVR